MSKKRDLFDYDTIRKHRPTLSDSSLRTYKSILTNLYKKMRPDSEGYNKDFFMLHPKEVIDFLKDVRPANRKTSLSALTVYTLDDPKVSGLYQNLMMRDGRVYQEEVQSQEKTKKQRENWISQEEVKTIYDNLEKVVKPIFNNYKEGDTIPVRDLEKIQDYVIASVYTIIPPRRLLDYTEFKVRNFTEGDDGDNYMKNGTFYFNKFKTAKYKKDSFKIPIRLKNIVSKWMKISGSDWLLFQSRNKTKHISPSFLNGVLHRIFGAGISVNSLRHSFLSEYYKNMPKLKDMGEVAEQMGHTVSTALEYVKKDD